MAHNIFHAPDLTEDETIAWKKLSEFDSLDCSTDVFPVVCFNRQHLWLMMRTKISHYDISIVVTCVCPSACVWCRTSRETVLCVPCWKLSADFSQCEVQNLCVQWYVSLCETYNIATTNKNLVGGRGPHTFMPPQFSSFSALPSSHSCPLCWP